MASTRIKRKPLAVLIATCPRIDCLLETSLPSVVAQTRKPDVLVIVTDKQPLSEVEIARITQMLGSVGLVILENRFSQGAAGSWNTGIDYLSTHISSCFIAILDDDDYWDWHHLAKCEEHSINAEVVISGINIVDRHNIVTSNVPSKLSSEDFLIGNPGWQGSNTFISLELLNRAGRFTNGMISCNDRDLAIRVLDLSPSIKFTNQATVYWTINRREDALSAKRSPQKLVGVCDFYNKYSNRMAQRQKDLFFNRIEHLFEWTQNEIEAELGKKIIENETNEQVELKRTNNAQS